ncbi:hypothetical protein LIER_41408 [Lithospermum erythrorhizon]|uniref:Uncharacterized protein n=1 Tax=Lithospermum erythrorhizon TaxID=34254 RepID=A0AAV3R8T2_LITER
MLKLFHFRLLRTRQIYNGRLFLKRRYSSKASFNQIVNSDASFHFRNTSPSIVDKLGGELILGSSYSGMHSGEGVMAVSRNVIHLISSNLFPW